MLSGLPALHPSSFTCLCAPSCQLPESVEVRRRNVMGCSKGNGGNGFCTRAGVSTRAGGTAWVHCLEVPMTAFFLFSALLGPLRIESCLSIGVGALRGFSKYLSGYGPVCIVDSPLWNLESLLCDRARDVSGLSCLDMESQSANVCRSGVHGRRAG